MEAFLTTSTVICPRPELDDLKAKVNVVELFRQHGVELKKSGKNWLCRCPFHQPDETPSLSVNPATGEWNCFGWKAGGDAIEFLRLKENLSFPEAVERLKQFTGPSANGQVEPKPSNGHTQPESSGNGLPGNFKRPELLARVAELYHKRFLESDQAQSYLSGRGLGSEV
jgi:DNA primase